MVSTFDHMNVITEGIGNEIRMARQRRYMKQKDLAQIINVSPSHMSAIECNRKYPGKDIIANIEKVLKCKLKLIDNPII